MKTLYKTPPIVWLKMTDYIHPWLDYEFGCRLRIGERTVLSIQHVDGVRPIFRMPSADDMTEKAVIVNSMSSTRRNCIVTGLSIDPDVMAREYGITQKDMDLFVPIECPKMCMSAGGGLRPWSYDICFSKEQASAMQRLLRGEFWKAVDEFNAEYARKKGGAYYPQIDMIEEFCVKTDTPDIYTETIRREWQRRVKRGVSGKMVAPEEECKNIRILSLM